jgi:hypothetical protein
MKKLELILLALLFIGCSSDDNDSISDCGCNAWVRQDGMIRTVIPVKLDCETKQPIDLPYGYIFLGCDNDNTP